MMDPNCASLLDSVSVGFANQTISSTGTRQSLNCSQSIMSHRVSCTGIYFVNQLNICQTHRVDILPKYLGSLFSEKVKLISTRSTPLFLQKSQIARVDQRDSQTFLIEWTEGDCLIANISQWGITIESALNESKILQLDFPYNCSTDLTDDRRNGSSRGRHRIILSRGQITCNSSILKTYGKLTDLLPCSDYTIRVSPSTRTMTLTDFGASGNFTTFYNPDGKRNGWQLICFM